MGLRGLSYSRAAETEGELGLVLNPARSQFELRRGWAEAEAGLRLSC